jgi:hypothetical protein
MDQDIWGQEKVTEYSFRSLSIYVIKLAISSLEFKDKQKMENG